MTTILTRLARDIDTALGGTECMDAIAASTADLSLVLWRFLAAVLRAMPEQPRDVQAVIDTVIAGMDKLGHGEVAVAAEWAAEAGVPRAAQRDILLRLIEEASDADV